jgi:murein DD-endopeptidase MepM/ murein hydrolase activator NlpD
MRHGAAIVITTIAALVLGLPVSGGLTAAETGWVWPLDPPPQVVRGFEPPTTPYGPGHRGVDLLGAAGQRVLSIGVGTVTFAGPVAGRGVVVVDHGRVSSTYQPVTASVRVGDHVTAGAMLGWLQGLHSHCLPAACLHLGLRRGDRYLDPLRLLPRRPVRLKPLNGLLAGDDWVVAGGGHVVLGG